MRDRWEEWNYASIMLATVIAMLVSSEVRADDTAVFRSYGNDIGSIPIYTDRPLNATSRRVFRLEYRALASRPQQNSIAERSNVVEPLVEQFSRIYGVDAALLKAIIDVESGFRVNARSAKGATGLMQVMPATAARYGRFNLALPEQNIDAGTRYLHDLLKQFGGDVQLAVAAYNAGEQAVRRHGFRIPPFPETVQYVRMVLERYRHYQVDEQHTHRAVLTATLTNSMCTQPSLFHDFRSVSMIPF